MHFKRPSGQKTFDYKSNIIPETILNSLKTNHENYILQIFPYVTDLKYVFSVLCAVLRSRLTLKYAHYGFC